MHKYFIILSVFLLTIIYFSLRKYNIGPIENFLANQAGDYPNSLETTLVEDQYRKIKQIGINNDQSEDIWWHYPIFQLGSYDQITNNIRYPNNPDEGTCMPASFCGTLYHSNITDNYSKELPPVTLEHGTRVGYFVTPQMLLPLNTKDTNLLY